MTEQLLISIYGLIPAWLVALVAVMATILEAYRFWKRIMPDRYELLVAGIVVFMFGAAYAAFALAPDLLIEARGGSIRLILMVVLMLSILWDADAIREVRQWSSHL